MEDFKITDELIFKLCFPVDFLHGNSLPEGVVDKLTIDSTGSKILNLLNIEVERSVDPFDKFLSGHEVGFIHDSDSDVVMHQLKLVYKSNSFFYISNE